MILALLIAYILAILTAIASFCSITTFVSGDTLGLCVGLMMAIVATAAIISLLTKTTANK